MLNTKGEVAEGTGDNIFVVKDGVISTPAGRRIFAGDHPSVCDRHGRAGLSALCLGTDASS